MSHLWSLQTGAQPQPDNSVRFTVWAPRAAAPRVRIHTGPARGDYPMTPSELGNSFFSAVVPGAGIEDAYAFVIDDVEHPDPVSRWQQSGATGASTVVDPTFPWTDDAWRGATMEELVICAVDVGTFTTDGTFAAAVARLPELKALGISAIELVSAAQLPGSSRAGKRASDGAGGLYAVEHGFGGPHDLKALIDAAHAQRIAVILDISLGNVEREGNELEAFGPYFSDMHRTERGAVLNIGGRDSDAVRRFVVDNALYWVREFHADGLWFDARDVMHDTSATHLFEEITYAVHDQAARFGKSALVIGASDLNDPRLVRPSGQYGYGLDAQQANDFHDAVRAVLTGERHERYADFGSVARIADAMREPFVYDGRYSAHRGRRHGASSIGIPRSRFIVSVEDHHVAGGRAVDDAVASSLAPNQRRLAAALLLFSPYVPLLVADDEPGRTDSDRALLRTLYRDLLTVRRDEPLLWPDRSRLAVLNGEPGWITLLREPLDGGGWSGGESALAVFNCTARPIDVPLPEPSGRAWTMRMATEGAAYGGSDEVVIAVAGRGNDDAPKRLTDAGARALRMPAWSAALYTATP